jgi:hypothetical protein
MTEQQPDLFADDLAAWTAVVTNLLITRLDAAGRPSARELLRVVEGQIGFKARWVFDAAVAGCAHLPHIRAADRAYFASMIQDGSVAGALRGEGAAEAETVSTIDVLLRQSAVYRSSSAFREMIQFMGRFKNYSPYNNMHVRLQNPGCGFFSTQKDWAEKHGRVLVEDARPMLILAPMHPVLLVYALDQTTGPPLPQKLLDFARFEGAWLPRWLENLSENARRYRIRVEFKNLSSTFGGFAALHHGSDGWKRRIVVHSGLDEPSRFGVLVHEMGHVLLGHLDADEDHWWPSRLNLSKTVVETEAEAVAHIVATRFGLKGDSAAYLSGYVKDGVVPQAVSVDHIAKVAGRIEQMAQGLLVAPKPRPPKPPRTAQRKAAA